MTPELVKAIQSPTTLAIKNILFGYKSHPSKPKPFQEVDVNTEIEEFFYVAQAERQDDRNLVEAIGDIVSDVIFVYAKTDEDISNASRFLSDAIFNLMINHYTVFCTPEAMIPNADTSEGEL